MRKDLHNNIGVRSALNTQAIAADGTTVGEVIDLRGFGALEFSIQAGDITDGDYSLVLEEGNDPVLADAVTVIEDNLIGDLANAAFDNTMGNQVHKIGYKVGPFRYARLSIVAAAVAAGGTFSAQAIVGNPDFAPVA